MKTVFFFLVSFLFISSCAEKNVDIIPNSKAKIIVVGGNERDFGEITAGEILSQRIYFQVEGKGEVSITNVVSDCGCTVVEWTKKPILAGEKAFVEVQFDSYGYVGMQNKSLLVESTASNSKIKINFFVNVK